MAARPKSHCRFLRQRAKLECVDQWPLAKVPATSDWGANRRAVLPPSVGRPTFVRYMRAFYEDRSSPAWRDGAAPLGQTALKRARKEFRRGNRWACWLSPRCALDARGVHLRPAFQGLGVAATIGQAKGRKGSTLTAGYAFPESSTIPQPQVCFRLEGLRTRGLQPAHGNVCGSR